MHSARPATPPEECSQDSRLVIDDQPSTPTQDPDQVNDDQFNSQKSMESIQIPRTWYSDDLGDPHHIREDIDGLHDSVDRKQVIIYMKLNDRGSSNTLKIEDLREHVGRRVTSREFFLNGQPEPANYDDDQTLAENVLALRNMTRVNRVSLDTFSQETTQEIQKLKDKDLPSSNSSSSTPNAYPKAEFNKLKKDVATALVKVNSLSKGNAFDTIDIKNRVLTLEKECQETTRKLNATSKSVGILKNGHGQSTSSENQLPIGINRFDERLLKLEEHAFGQQSRGLFDSTMETTVDLLSKEVQDLRKDLKLDLASSHMNEWLNTKMKAFLDTPVFTERIRSEMKNFMVNYQIEPRNMPQDTRQKLIQV